MLVITRLGRWFTQCVAAAALLCAAGCTPGKPRRPRAKADFYRNAEFAPQFTERVTELERG